VLRRRTRLEEIDRELAQSAQTAQPTLSTTLESDKVKLLGEVDQRERQLTIVTNGTYLAIIASVVAFFFLGLQPRGPTLELSKLVEAATKEAALMRAVKATDLKVIAVELSPSGDVYTVQLMPQASATPWVLEVNASDGRIRKFL